MRHRLRSAIVAAALLATTLACEGRTSGLLVSGPTGSVRVRLLNALTSSASLDFLVDAQVAASGVAFGNASPYASLSTGSHRLQARSTSGTSLVDFTRDFNTDGAFSFVLAPGLTQSGALLIPDDPTPASAGQAKLRVVHVAATPGAVAVYVTTTNQDLTTATPFAASVGFGTASGYATLAPGTYRVRVTPVGNPGTVLLDIGNVPFGAGTVRTLMLTDAPGGGLPTTLSIVADGN